MPLNIYMCLTSASVDRYMLFIDGVAHLLFHIQHKTWNETKMHGQGAMPVLLLSS